MRRKIQKTCPSTCVYVGLSEKQRETLHSVKGVEMMNALMEAVHAVLMLDEKKTSKHLSFASPNRQRRAGCVCVYLRQAGEDGGAAGGAAAHRGEGVLKHQAALSQGAKVRGAHHRVVVHLRLKARVVSWKRDDEPVSSCATFTTAKKRNPNRKIMLQRKTSSAG